MAALENKTKKGELIWESKYENVVKGNSCFVCVFSPYPGQSVMITFDKIKSIYGISINADEKGTKNNKMLNFDIDSGAGKVIYEFIELLKEKFSSNLNTSDSAVENFIDGVISSNYEDELKEENSDDLDA